MCSPGLTSSVRIWSDSEPPPPIEATAPSAYPLASSMGETVKRPSSTSPLSESLSEWLLSTMKRASSTSPLSESLSEWLSESLLFFSL